MSVGKIFKTLIVIVACVVIGAVVLNVLLPNATTSLVNTVENQIYNATGLEFDFNGDGTYGSSTNRATSAGAATNSTNNSEDTTANVNGFN